MGIRSDQSTAVPSAAPFIVYNVSIITQNASGISIAILRFLKTHDNSAHARPQTNVRIYGTSIDSLDVTISRIISARPSAAVKMLTAVNAIRLFLYLLPT